ncbi:unnamed protein product, partial [Mesorhabditis spiculigera]
MYTHYHIWNSSLTSVKSFNSPIAKKVVASFSDEIPEMEVVNGLKAPESADRIRKVVLKAPRLRTAKRYVVETASSSSASSDDEASDSQSHSVIRKTK